MPHRPERGGSVSTATMYSRVTGLTEEATSHIMRPSSVGMYAHHHHAQAGLVTPLMSTKPWLTAHHPGAAAMLPALDNPKSSDSADRSTATKQDEECTVGTLTTEPSADEREATANALLLVSTAAVRHDSATGGFISAAGTSNYSGESTDAGAKVPLKKRRKKHSDFLRRNIEDDKGAAADDENQLLPCHVSPVSHSSVEGRTVSHEETTPSRSSDRLEATAERSHSYDSKDLRFQKGEATQELLDCSKIHNAKDITLPSQVIISHFPSVLHRVLADTEFAGSVVTWLPDGESWKVLRWDALRRQVLPRYFSSLRDENGEGCGTIDAFLYHLTAWGFEEVKDGSDVGAYRHDLFIRGAQKLSNKMRFTATATSLGPKTVSPPRLSRQGDDRSMLQVPTLSALGRANAGVEPNAPIKRARYDEQSSPAPIGAIRRTSPGPMNWAGYRPEDPYADALAWGNYYSDPGRMYPVAMYSDSRYNNQGLHHRPMPAVEHMGAQSSHVYPPPQVRSGRGAMRVTGSTRPPASSPVNAPAVSSSLPSFPVSNRGKGRKTPVSIRIGDASLSAKPSGTSSPPTASVTLEEAQRIGNSVKGGIAMAISRKAKRKLPLSRNVDKLTN